MVTGQNAPEEILEFLSGHVPTHRQSTQQQNMIRQLSRGNTLPILENTHKQASKGHNTSIKKLAKAIAGVSSQQRPTKFAILKPESTNTLMFDGRNEKFKQFADLFHTMLKMQPEMREAIKVNHSHAHLKKEASQPFRNINANNRTNLEEVIIVFSQKYVKLESQATAKHDGTCSVLTRIQNHFQTF